MTDHKFTDEEILEAMEHCVKNLCHCGKCPRFERGCDTCHEDLYLDILALINRQKAENESLQEAIGRKEDIIQMLCNQTQVYYDELVSAKAEIERLNKCIKTEDEVREIMKSQMLPMVREITVEQIDRAKEIGRIEAVKEFAERLKDELSFGRYIQVDQIDNLVKEMTEERTE